MARIHPTAIIDARADLAADVVVGAYAIVESGVVIGRGCSLHPHSVVRTGVTLGSLNIVHPFAVIGGAPQIKGREEKDARLEVGEANVFREHVTVHGGTDGRTTRVGDGNLFMVGSHVAHDVAVGNQCVLANGAQLAGHAVVEDWVTFGGLSGVTQHVRVGESAFVAATSACERDVPPFVVVQGDRARVRAANVVGLRRRGVPEASVAAIERAVRKVWMSGRPRADVLREVEGDDDPWVRKLLQALGRERP